MLTADMEEVTAITQSIADAVAREVAKMATRIDALEAQVTAITKATAKVTKKEE